MAGCETVRGEMVGIWIGQLGACSTFPQSHGIILCRVLRDVIHTQLTTLAAASACRHSAVCVRRLVKVVSVGRIRTDTSELFLVDL